MAKKISTVLRNVLSALENPEYPSLGPQLYLLSLVGMWYRTYTKAVIFKQIIFWSIMGHMASRYIKCLIHLNPNCLKSILKYSSVHICVIKFLYFKKHYKLWEKLVEYTATTEKEQLVKNDSAVIEKINNYVSKNRKITYFYCIMIIGSIILIFPEPYINKILADNSTISFNSILDAYTIEEENPQHYIYITVLTIIGITFSTLVTAYDILIYSLLIFFAGQLKIARIYCSHVINMRDQEESHKNVAEFHKFYITLVKQQNLLNSLMYFPMFAKLVLVSGGFAILIIDIVQTDQDLQMLISTFQYFLACLIDLLIFYWYANEVTVQSELVSYSTFESDWPGSDIRLQKEVLLLAITTTKQLVFMAGPFNEMSLTTFVAILKFGYSFYTLLREMN